MGDCFLESVTDIKSRFKIFMIQISFTSSRLSGFCYIVTYILWKTVLLDTALCMCQEKICDGRNGAHFLGVFAPTLELKPAILQGTPMAQALVYIAGDPIALSKLSKRVIWKPEIGTPKSWVILHLFQSVVALYTFLKFIYRIKNTSWPDFAQMQAFCV